MGKEQERMLRIVMTFILLVSVYFVGREAAKAVDSDAVQEKEEYCVVVDAGHGGDDPGKVGIGGAIERDLNLQIAQKLQKFLEASDVKVVMTREDQDGLYDRNVSNKKVQDMKKRIELIEEAEPDLVVSIHQNSYGEEYVKGAQVFYYKDSEKGKELAEYIQNRLVQNLDPGNTRGTKANDSYYLLKKTDKPIVICECGFLSNAQEAARLCEEIYQEQLAWQIHMAVIQYLNVQNHVTQIGNS